jgi:hypothetical protein
MTIHRAARVIAPAIAVAAIASAGCGQLLGADSLTIRTDSGVAAGATPSPPDAGARDASAAEATPSSACAFDESSSVFDQCEFAP